MLNQIHDIELWLENGKVKIMKKIIHAIIGYPKFDKKKIIRCQRKYADKESTKAEWNDHGILISNIIDPLIDFAMREITHKFYQSSRLSSVSCMTVDQAWKMVIKYHEYDLFELQWLQLVENLLSIKVAKNSMCKLDI